jgi:hypothetical protein
MTAKARFLWRESKETISSILESFAVAVNDVQTPRAIYRGMLFTQTRGQTQNGMPFDWLSNQSSAPQVSQHFSMRLPLQQS